MTSLIHTPDVLARIQREDPSWEAMVPATVAEMIKRKNLFATCRLHLRWSGDRFGRGWEALGWQG